MIIVDNISKSYGSQELFRNASFRLSRRERLGLVGRNGHGKTTLFRLILGEEEVDDGLITVPRNYTIGHVTQKLDFTSDTVLGEGCRGLARAEKDHFWKVEKVLFGLGFDQSDMEKHPSELSGGFQVRLNLAKVLVRDVDLLLLDEPNNYLDITSIRWLTRFLNDWRGELMLITHDRSFMDHVVTHTMGVYRKTLRKIRGDTGKLYSQLAAEEEVYEKTRINDEKKRKKAEEFIRRFRAKARLGNLVQSRIKTLEKQKKLEKLEKAKDLDFSFTSRPFNGKPVMQVNEISFGYEPDRLLFSELSFSIGPFDKICVVGQNGKGKTTLMKALSGRIHLVSGEVALNPTAAVAGYEQENVKSLRSSRTVLDEILSADPAVDQQKARNISGMMMFEGDAALKKIRVLSGGEKSRVMLGKIIATPVNLLLLDEPTNHLDMESCDALLEAINDFEGAVLMVTHNEMLLHGLAEKLIVFQEGRAVLFDGSYQRFLELKGWGDEKLTDPGEKDPPEVERKRSRKDYKRLRSEFNRERGRRLKPLEKKVDTLESKIVGLEGELANLHQAMAKAATENDSLEIASLSRKIFLKEREMEESFQLLENVSKGYEEQKALWEKKLNELEKQAGGE
ncbi:MAG: ATP-binding cassette domain-containing protein [Candidatus Krumholzibacteriota bacterium]|nr:ATP-binding cassette domain-containing protein [Candidatus Krumholzibacteriota bacterium]